jgi:transcriptional regulator with XRE-family HTH domain
MPKRKIDWYGPRLRALREQAGLSQAALGERVSLAGSQINKLETNVNQPTLATALAIAEALGVPIAEFIPERETLVTAAGEAAKPKGRPQKQPVEPPTPKRRRKKGE